MVDPSPNNASKRKSSSSTVASSTSKSYTHKPTIPATSSSKTNSEPPFTKYSRSLNKFIDMELVDIDPIRAWVKAYLTTYHIQDAPLLYDLVFDRLTNEKWPDPKVLQAGLGDVFMLPLDAREFVKRLWLTLTSQINHRDSSSRKKMRKE